MAGSCWNTGGGVADVRRLAVNEEGLKGVLQMATKRLRVACLEDTAVVARELAPVGLRRGLVGAAEGCDLFLALESQVRDQRQKIAAFGSSYRGGGFVYG
jgi:hypothetical protein